MSLTQGSLGLNGPSMGGGPSRPARSINLADLEGIKPPMGAKPPKRSNGVKPAGPMVAGKGGNPVSPVSQKSMGAFPPAANIMAPSKGGNPVAPTSRKNISGAPPKANPMVSGKVQAPKSSKQATKALSPMNKKMSPQQGL